jgi:molybdopterin/thiamine biosynthesis adenylyltransferase
VHPPGQRIVCNFICLSSLKELELATSNIPAILSKVGKERKALALFFALDNGTLRHDSYFVDDIGGTIKCQIRFIPEKSDLYSRNKGLLETEALARKKVGIVGLGSGGSPIAIELAKAGVGNFVLIDFDRLELSNVSRHICGINDLGRFKTFAVRDAILQKNPHASITTLEIDVNERRDECILALETADLLACASDNDRSRFFLNEIALKYKIPALFGRAITRATGGDVLRVRPFQGPCYSCLYSQNIRQEGGDDEEISQTEQANALLPEYTSKKDIDAVIQVGLSSDIAPISNFMVKLALVELSRGLDSGIKSLEDDLISDFYIWANRRDRVYENWSKMEFNFNKPSILRWYGARVKRDPNCMVCGL